MTQALSQHISFKHFKKNPLILNISVLLCIVPVPHLTIYCCWLDQQGGVVIGVTVLQPEGLGSIPLDSQNPPCWGALQQDMEFLPAAGMQFRLTLAWRGTTQPPHSCEWGFRRIRRRQKKRRIVPQIFFYLARIARCYLGQSNTCNPTWTLCFYFLPREQCDKS